MIEPNLANPEKLQKDLETIVELLQRDFDGVIKVKVHHIPSGINAGVRENEPGWAASIIKVPIMLAVLEEVKNKKISLLERIPVNHKFKLEDYDFVSSQSDVHSFSVSSYINYMIVNSDNEATNILADRIGIPFVNDFMWEKLGLEKTMLGHLLCPGAPRYTSDFNEDGSNLTTPEDMVRCMRHIYETQYSKLGPKVSFLARAFMENTSSSHIKTGKYSNEKVRAKLGYISDFKDGSDIHEVGIINDKIAVCIMLNKVGKKYFFGGFSQSQVCNVIMNTIAKNLGEYIELPPKPAPKTDFFSSGFVDAQRDIVSAQSDFLLGSGKNPRTRYNY